MNITLVTYLVVSMVIISGITKGEDELIMVNLLYRHGARSPVNIYPSDPNQLNSWPDGTGRLTQHGMQLEFEIGEFLKERYVQTKFINQSYLHREVTIRSSGVDRCLQSAETQLAGLYPPQGWQIWNPKLLWQPIPIQTVPEDEDPLLRPENTKNCPEYDRLITRLQQNSDEFHKHLQDNAELIKYMQNYSGMGESLTYKNLWIVSDCTLSELAEGMEPPKWVKDRWKEIKDLAFYLFSFRYKGTGVDGDLLGRLTGGTLLGKMIGNMKNYTSGDAKEKEKYYKMNIFSAHDSTILSLSAALKIEMNETIPFAALILVELFQNSQGGYYVKIMYRHNGTLSVWKLPDCTEHCPLDDFITKTKARVPTNRAKDCKAVADPGFFTYHRLTIISAVLLSLTIFFFVVILWVCIRKRYKRKNRNYNIQDDEQSKSLIS